MTHSGTRAALAPYEGQLLHIRGRLKEYKTRPDGLVDVCVVNCEVRPYDPDIALSDTPPLRFDHVWNKGCDPAMVDRSLLSWVSGLGRAKQYARADGSVDWTVDTVPCTSIEVYLDSVGKDYETLSDRRPAALGALQCVLRHAAAGDLVYSYFEPTNRLLERIKADAESLEHSLATQLRVALTSPSAGPCKGLDLLPLGRRRPKRRQQQHQEQRLRFSY